MFRLSLALLPLLVMTSPSMAQDAEAGQRVFTQCRACHQVGENARNAVGPQLNGLFGRKAGSVEGYRYSAAFTNLDKVWDEENFDVYIRNPREVTPGTKMVFAGIKDDQRIKDLIAYLRQFDAAGVRTQ